ncbi:hypothetical protein OSB04_un000095 [Centaurea solstitialis]|uniref:Reverse transcriptase domain-containing protein n=1 Tax=Centaurea solstitialis TaxID=347529 RepID=A0AA38SIC4_9ASTR|nr:hypothetical protein OSB04_un000095 [Centaurea solstitialis]
MQAVTSPVKGIDGLGDHDPSMVVEDVLSDDDGGGVHVSTPHVRKSVFERLETDERLKFSPVELYRFFPLATKAQSSVRIPKELASEVMKTHRSTLFGYFLGPRLHFPVVERYVKAAWGKFGFTDAMMDNNGIYFFKFNDFGGSAQVVEAGPLMIRGVPLFVEHWDPVKGLSKPVHNSCPLWVKLHNVPLVAFNKEGISRIASALGVPKQMDACTASMCDKAWGRPGFAKVLIETWAVGELKREIQVLIPSLHGGNDVTVTIKVEYLWEPTQCSHCLVFGHKTATCVKALVAQKSKGKTTIVDDQGFTKVQRKEWKPKNLASTSGTKQGTSMHDDKVGGDVEPTLPEATVKEGETTKELDLEQEGGDLRDQSQESQPTVVSVTEKIGGEASAIVATREDATVRHFTAPLEVPLKTILKNTNRFSPLQEASVARGDGGKGKEQVRITGISSRANIDAPKKPSGVPRQSRHGKQEEVKNLIHLNSVNICAIVESHVRLEMLSQICKKTFGRWLWVSNQGRCSFGTRIIVAWDQSLFDIMVLNMSAQCMNCQVRIRGSDVVFFLTVVCGANKATERQPLWSDLRKFAAILGNKPWVLTGDFNALLFPHDAFGGSSMRNQDMLDFFTCVEDIEVFDLRYSGIQHTWCQKPKDESGLRRKLDRVMANIAFTSLFANASVMFLPRGVSDHSPSLLSFKGGVTQKLKALKKPLRSLRNTYGDLNLRAIKLKTELDVIQIAADMDPFNLALREDLEFLRVAYQQARHDEEVAIMQRAKVDGMFVYDDDVPGAFVDNLQALLGTSDDSINPDMPDQFFVNTLSLAESLDMIRPISDADIRHAIFSIGNDKAPGSDGFSATFFKAAWNVIGPEVMRAIHNFFYRSRLDKEINHTLLCLLPKSPNASSVTDFRPISCCTVLYKCISKILVDRIKPYLDGLVSRSQSAFIPGRRIVDNILMAHELVVGYHLQVGQPRCAFKIDIRKAYDMVDWRFLFNMLSGVGFHPALVRWIKEMVTSASYSIALNGETYGFFKGERGIRQGDPLSPYLFTLVMEGFSMIFRDCIREALNFGYHPGCVDLEITHLCFADDLFVFTRGDVGSVDVLKRALQVFSTKSGLHPSLEKSEVFFGNVPPETQTAILESLEFKPGVFPICYLGVPLSPISLKVAEYGGLIAKVKARISNWKTKFLSFGGRKQLVSSVLQSLHLYWMAVFLFPSAVVHELEALCRDFLWAQGNSSKGKSKVAWDMVCKQIACGGLGIRRISAWNRALLAKHVWDLCSRRNSLWVTWIHRYCIRQDSFWTMRVLPKWSWSFRKLLSLREEFRPFVRVRIGDGKSTNAWEDNWLGIRLSSYISYRAIHSAGFLSSWTVADLYASMHGVWPTDWLSRFPHLAGNAFPTLTDDLPDSLCWDNDDSGVFLVRNAYNSIIGNFDEVPWWRTVWFKGHIPKHAFCLWIACVRRLPTQDRISIWKHEPPDLVCPLCGDGPDSHTHLFFTCVFAKEVWSAIRVRMEWEDFPDAWDDIMVAISDPVTSPKGLVRKLSLAASVYAIWRERNKRLFRGDKKSTHAIISEISEVVRLRVAWKMSKDKQHDDVDAACT